MPVSRLSTRGERATRSSAVRWTSIYLTAHGPNRFGATSVRPRFDPGRRSRRRDCDAEYSVHGVGGSAHLSRDAPGVTVWSLVDPDLDDHHAPNVPRAEGFSASRAGTADACAW